MSDTNKLKELQNGDVKIANEVIATIANIATTEIDGVVQFKGGIASDIADMFGVKNNAKGVKVNTDENTITLNVSVVVAYGTRIQEMAEQIQRKVKENIETMTDLMVEAVNVHVVGVKMASASGSNNKDE